MKLLLSTKMKFLNKGCCDNIPIEINYIPLTNGNFWTYNVNTNAQTLRDSLYISNDFLKLQNANLENSLAAQNNIVAELRTGLSTAIQKAISENAERTGLEAENAGLVAQKTALLKQIDTLNNLVSTAQTAVSKTQEAVGPMNELKTGGGFAIGNLASILFDDLSSTFGLNISNNFIFFLNIWF